MSLFQDFQHGIRLFVHSPAYAAVASGTLALGIGAATLMFSVLSPILTASAPVPDLDRLVAIWSYNPGRGDDKSSVSWPDFDDWRRDTGSFAAIAASRSGAFNLATGDQPARVAATLVTEDYFRVFALRAARGRVLEPSDFAGGAAQAIVIGDRMWRVQFASDPAIIGREVRLDDRPATIVGVLRPEVRFAELFAPLMTPAPPVDRGARDLFVFARLVAGVSRQQAADDVRAVAERLAEAHPGTNAGWTTNTVPAQEEFLGRNARTAFAIMSAAVVAVLLIGCANVAGLVLSRSSLREREIVVRAALGASRVQIVRQLMMEHVVIAFVGGVVGAALAGWGLTVLRAMMAGDTAIVDEMRLNSTVLLFAAALSLATTLLFGLWPAVRASRPDLAEALRFDARTMTRSGGWLLRRGLIAAEVALAIVLLVMSGLLARTLIGLRAIPNGFASDHVLTASLTLAGERYRDAEAQAAFWQRALDALRGQPDVEAAGVATRIPTAGSRYNPVRTIEIEGRPVTADSTWAVDLVVSPGYFAVLRLPILAGRDLDDRDTAGALPVAVISQAMAKKYWGTASPVGARIRPGTGNSAPPWRTVVGVVHDVRNDDIDQPPLPQIYMPAAQAPRQAMTFVVRTRADPAAFAPALRAAVASVDRELPLYEMETLDAVIERDLADTSVLISLVILFAVLALALAAVGVYGVVASQVSQRTREIGVRMALGARWQEVLRFVSLQALVPVAAGVLLGFVAAYGTTGLMRSLLYQVSPTDGVTFVGVAATIMIAAVIATAGPALRAARLDPVKALRDG